MSPDSSNAQRFVLIANPTAGRGRAARFAHSMADELARAGRVCELVWTDAPSGAEGVARRAIDNVKGEPACLVPVGGDGTVQQVANAIVTAAGSPLTLGLAPVGRCNDFAAQLGVPSEPRAAARFLLAGRPHAIDLGRVNDRYFCTIAALGFDAAVSRFVNEMKVPLHGTPAYIYGVMRMLGRYRSVPLRLRMDGRDESRTLFLVASANTAAYGGRMQIAPGADPTDGLLDFCLVCDVRALRVLRLLHRVINGRHTDLPEVAMHRAQSLTIESEAPMEVWADGEPVGATPARIESVAGALRVMLSAAPRGGASP